LELDAEGNGSRSAAGRQTDRFAGRDGRGAPLSACLADERPSAMPEQSFLRAEIGRCVRRALSALPYDYRKAVVLADVQGYSYEEIAQHVGCPVGTIRSRLHRGRQLLRQNILKLQSQEEGAELRNESGALHEANGHVTKMPFHAAGDPGTGRFVIAR
jgi:DNA-directed RNA polymerase specialized sigma24 family protein